ncbi:M14 family metallopeptidase [Parapedobacter koreensis]|uniref:Zinc carboxypeptidase n=1 Tax=Parapedobacter koreensis TaxID=332977 RepID=A0A1H7U5M3_9SPHI|nr:M14 family metallopeptidase [Parapedobacter koreensis]SEL91547.1 Zinc carboxypeptidase [Parapedobacter koreensis]
MKSTSITLFLLVFFSFLTRGQRSLEVWPESDTTTTFYTVKGERSGISYFKKHQFEEVEYVPKGTLTFDKFHTPDVIYHWYKKWADQYPDLIDFYEVARSFEGRPIYQMTLTNKKTGKDTDKPAAYFEGVRHSGEITSSESVLWLTKHLIENYGKDPQITALIDTKTIYLRPINNPDGVNLYMHTAQRNRSTTRPDDNDGDGLYDEDPEEDLDGDGVIYQMRKKAVGDELKRANYVIDERDASGQLMKRVPEGEGEWLVYPEGVDNDKDGRYNEDGIGGLDLHRNYPENWRPEPGVEATGRGYTQRGAGPFPLSETETRSVVLWLLSHPNISVVNSMDTSVPMHLRPPSTSKSAESMFPEDLAIYKHMDSLGLSFTGYPWAGDVYETYATRNSGGPGDPPKPSPLFGHGPDFGYFYYGAIWYGDELWNGGRHEDLDGDGEIDVYDGYLWDQKNNGGRGYKPWTKFIHPDLGEVEIGGAHPKFFSQNAPPSVLEKWAKNQALFNLAMSFELPQLQFDDVAVKALSNNEYEVTVSWTNTGKLPVALEQAKLVKIVQEDQVLLDIDRKLLSGGENAAVVITSPETRDKTFYAGYTKAGESKTASFKVQLKQQQPVKAKIKLSSTRGGYLEREITIGN